MNVSTEILGNVIAERAMRRAISENDLTGKDFMQILQEEAALLVGSDAKVNTAVLVSYAREKCLKLLGTLQENDPTEMDGPVDTVNGDLPPVTQGQINNRLRNLRLDRGITQSTLASLANIEPANLSRIENGHVDPCLSTILKILSAMGCSLRDLAN